MLKDFSPRSPATTLLTAGLGTLLVLVDYTSPLTTLSPTAAALHASPTAQTWVLTGMLASLAALLLTMGSAADDYGRRRIFVAGAVLSLVSTVLSAAAPDIAVFLAGRVLQGCAGAALLAPSLGLIGHAYPAGPARIRALGVWGASVGLGIAVGPVYAALIERGIGWRGVYWGLAIVSAVVLLLAVATLTESRSDNPRRLDPLGVITLAAGTACLVGGLAEGRYGWGRGVTITLLVVGVALTAGFVLVEWRVREPMLELSLFRTPGFIASISGAFFTGLSIVGLMSFLPTVIQKALGQSPLTASGVLAIWSGLSVVSALQARRMAGRVSATTQLAASLFVCGVGEAALYGLHAGSSWTHLAPGLIVAGIGSGVLNSALARIAVSSVPPSRAAMGSGANNSARYLGSSLGVAIVITVVEQAKSPRGAAEAMAVGSNHAALVSGVLCAVGAAIALWARVAETRAAAGERTADSAVAAPAAAKS